MDAQVCAFVVSKSTKTGFLTARLIYLFENSGEPDQLASAEAS